MLHSVQTMLRFVAKSAKTNIILILIFNITSSLNVIIELIYPGLADENIDIRRNIKSIYHVIVSTQIMSVCCVIYISLEDKFGAFIFGLACSLYDQLTGGETVNWWMAGPPSPSSLPRSLARCPCRVRTQGRRWRQGTGEACCKNAEISAV